MAKFFPDTATKIVISVQEEMDSEIGMMYAIGAFAVFAGETKLNPNIGKVNLECPDPLFTSFDDPFDVYEFLDAFVADLPIPFTIGDLTKDLEVEVNLIEPPIGIGIAQHVWLED